MPSHHATVEQKNGVLEFGELEYYNKWYLPIYFRNSVLLLKSSKKGGIGPFWPEPNLLFKSPLILTNLEIQIPNPKTHSDWPVFFFLMGQIGPLIMNTLTKYQWAILYG